MTSAILGTHLWPMSVHVQSNCNNMSLWDNEKVAL